MLFFCEISWRKSSGRCEGGKSYVAKEVPESRRKDEEKRGAGSGEVRGRKSEGGSQRAEVGGRRAEVGGRRAEGATQRCFSVSVFQRFSFSGCGERRPTLIRAEQSASCGLGGASGEPEGGGLATDGRRWQRMVFPAGPGGKKFSPSRCPGFRMTAAPGARPLEKRLRGRRVHRARLPFILAVYLLPSVAGFDCAVCSRNGGRGRRSPRRRDVTAGIRTRADRLAMLPGESERRRRCGDGGGGAAGLPRERRICGASRASCTR